MTVQQQPNPPTESLRQLPLPGEALVAQVALPTIPPAVPGGPSLRPRTIWRTLTPAQQAQALQIIRRVVQDLLRKELADGHVS